MKLLLGIAFVLSTVFSNAQKKWVQKVYAFYEKQVNENLLPGKNSSNASMDYTIVHSIFIEVPGDASPIWETATIKGDTFAVHSTLIEEMPFKLGERKSDGRMVVIKTQPGSRLWKLEFDLLAENKNNETQNSGNEFKVELYAVYNKRTINYTISRQVELVPRL